MIEKEIKALISKSQYENIFNSFEWNKIFVQVNHYYVDPDGAQKNSNISIRVREANNSIKLQMKKPITLSGMLHVEDEYEYEYSFDAVPDIITNLNVRDIKLVSAKKIGELITKRCVYYFDKFTEICLDKNEYLNFIDYELEVEFNGDLPYKVKIWLENLGINNNSFVPGKYSRFMTRKNEVGEDLK